MSGEKDSYVQLRQSEYNRMMNSCRRLDNLKSEVQSNLGAMAGELNRQLNTRMSKVSSRFDKVDKRMSGMSREMQRIEKDQNRRIREHARQFQKGINSLGREMVAQRREYLDMIQEQSRQFSRAMQEQRRALEGQIKNIQQALEQKEASEREQAMQWFEDTRNYLDMIANEYRHEKFAPGTLEKIRQEMQLVGSNIENGHFQAGIAAAQQSFIRASELRQDLEQKELEWEAHLEAAKQSSAEFLAACKAQEAARFALETEEGAEEVAGEIDFWTKGGLSGLRQKAEEELNDLNNPEAFSLGDLKKAIQDSEQGQKQCEDLAEKAKEALIASQLRNNIGQAIEAALADANWVITDATYEGEDFRGSVHVKMENLQGDEMLTVISPEPGADEKSINNRVNISFFDRNSNNETFRQQRLKSILKILEEDGLQCAQPKCVPGTENQPCQEESRLDLDRVRQTRPEAAQGRR
jgi:hypothetical protein